MGGVEEGGREGAREKEDGGGGWAHPEASAAGHVPFVERLIERGGADEEVLRREREPRGERREARGER